MDRLEARLETREGLRVERAARTLGWTMLLMLLAGTAAAQDAEPALDTGDTAWILVSTALVLFMTIPGLALSTAGWCARRTCCRC